MIETSGVSKLTGDWDWICLSPKQFSPPVGDVFERANELKVIIQKPADLRWAEKNAAKVGDSCLLYLQPEWSVAKEILELLADYVMQHPQWRISLQSHKYIGIP